MKNLIFVFTLACFFSTFNLNAQSPMVKGQNIAMIGIGLGGYGGAYESSASPTFTATFQKGLIENLGPGNLSIGGTLAFKTGKYDKVKPLAFRYFVININKPLFSHP